MSVSRFPYAYIPGTSGEYPRQDSTCRRCLLRAPGQVLVLSAKDLIDGHISRVLANKGRIIDESFVFKKPRCPNVLPYVVLGLVLAAFLWVWWIEYKSVAIHELPCQSVYACTERMANDVLGENND